MDDTKGWPSGTLACFAADEVVSRALPLRTAATGAEAEAEEEEVSPVDIAPPALEV